MRTETEIIETMAEVMGCFAARSYETTNVVELGALAVKLGVPMVDGAATVDGVFDVKDLVTACYIAKWIRADLRARAQVCEMEAIGDLFVIIRQNDPVNPEAGCSEIMDSRSMAGAWILAYRDLIWEN